MLLLKQSNSGSCKYQHFTTACPSSCPSTYIAPVEPTDSQSQTRVNRRHMCLCP